MLEKLTISILFIVILSIVIQPSFGLTKDEILKINQKALEMRVSGKILDKTQDVKPTNKTNPVEPTPDDSTIKKFKIKNKRMEIKELMKSYKKQEIERTEFLKKYAMLRAQINSLNQ